LQCCRTAARFSRAIAGVATMAVAINAADRNFSFVIRFSPLDRKSQQRLAFVQLIIGLRFINTTK
jgi:hypothetical protein